MRRKSLLYLLIGAVTLLSMSSVSAAVLSEEIELGGITLGMPQEVVQRTYGNPIERNRYGGDFYGNGLYVSVLSEKAMNIRAGGSGNGSENKYYVSEIKIKDDCPLTTPSGIGLDSSVDEVLFVYGEPDAQRQKPGCDICYIYYGSDMDGKQLMFYIKNEKLVRISCYLSD